jgi:hypothetical protein
MSELAAPSQSIDDNARKFIVGTIDRAFLTDHSPLAYDMTVDWLKTNPADETKLALKEFDDNTVQILHIAKIKVSEAGDRKSVKTEINDTEYKKRLAGSLVQVVKRRYEFEYIQGTTFSVKYDEFADNELRILEVDAATEQARKSFRPDMFPYALTEVTGIEDYYGYRIAAILEKSRRSKS